jgi:hypothetical protein
VYDVADPIDRDQYLQRLAAIIGTDVSVLRELLRRRMHVVQRPNAPTAPSAAPPGAQHDTPSSQSAPERARPPAPTPGALSPADRLQDLVLALLLRAGGAEVWPDPADVTSTTHRAILQQLLAGPPWPDAATAIYRLHDTLGGAVAETLQRIQAREAELDRLSPEDVARELDVRRLELRKHRLLGQYQALNSALNDEGGGLNIAAHRASHEQLRLLFEAINDTIAEQQRLGVVGTASWSIRRGQEVLGG